MKELMNKGRLEAFTDAIVAIAATIMVLELHTPASNDWRGLSEELPTFLAYVISFIMIYVVWYSHHNLFIKADNITPRIYLLNGLWIFFLTLVPFTTAWVGSSIGDTMPEFVYPLNFLLWSGAFQLLDRQILRDNPEAKKDSTTRLFDRVFMYGGYVLCMILSFVYPPLSLYVIGVVSVVMIVRIFVAKEK